MIDDGELDWKVIVIKADDPMAAVLNDVPDIEKNLPGYITGARLTELRIRCGCLLYVRVEYVGLFVSLFSGKMFHVDRISTLRRL